MASAPTYAADVAAAPPVPKKMPLTTAFGPAVPVTRKATCPETSQDRYWPPEKAVTVRESSSAPVAGSTTSTRSARPPPSQSSRYRDTRWARPSVRLTSTVKLPAYQVAATRSVAPGFCRARASVVVAAHVYELFPAGVTWAYAGQGGGRPDHGVPVRAEVPDPRPLRRRVRPGEGRRSPGRDPAGVVAWAVLDQAESPPALNARTRKEYVVPGESPVAAKVVALAPVVPARTNVVPSVDFSTRYPSSLLALSCQVRLTWVPEAAAAARPVGAAGAGGGAAGAPKKIPLRTAFGPAVAVTRRVTRPVTVQDRYWPPAKLEMVRESRTAPVAGSTTSTRSARPPRSQSKR